MSTIGVPLSDSLRTLLPGRKETLFLQSCVLEGPELAAAWQSWLVAVGDPLRYLAQEGHELRSHLALLYRHLSEHSIGIPRALQPYLRSAVVRGKLRYAQYEACLRDFLEAFRVAGIDATLVKGPAVSATEFSAEPFLRHCHDLDVLIDPDEVETASRELQARGYQRRWSRFGSTRLDHPMGLPVLLHTRLFQDPTYSLAPEPLWFRRREVTISTGSVRVLAPADMLVHVCGHASTIQRRPHMNWVIDASRIAARMTARDWQQFLEVATAARLSLPLAVLLGELATRYAVAVPHNVEEPLLAAATDVDREQRFAAMEGARLGCPGGLRNLLGCSGWRSKLSVACGLALPPWSHMRSKHLGRTRPKVLSEYVVRPFRFVWSQLTAQRASAVPVKEPLGSPKT
ncbi:MAG: nucleotidyltransferase family protein [Planctomycetota bacterium]